MKQPVCASCYYNRVVGDVLAERTYRLTDDSYLCVRCHPQCEPINLPPSPDEVETLRRKAAQYDAILNPGEMIHRSTLLLVEADRDSLRTQLAEAVALLRRLTYERSYTPTHERAFDDTRAFLARIDGKGGK